MRFASVFIMALAAAAYVALYPSRAADAPLPIDQGAAWTPAARELYYTQDQGAQLIPLTWLRALRTKNGKPILDGALARYGFLPNRNGPAGLPVGFTVASSPEGAMAGMTCAACHTRDLTVGRQTWRVDGAPALIDFQSFLADLNAAVLDVARDDVAFHVFSRGVLGEAPAPEAIARLRADVAVWSVRFDTLMSRALPADRPWGPARLDAMSMIYDRLVGLDLGPPPTYLIPDNIVRADAPVRYPFLWNSSRQDFAQWAGFQKNGSDVLALARNLGQAYGIFVTFHPRPTSGPASRLNVDYVGDNSANLAGLATLEGLIKRMGPPRWPWPVDAALAARGKVVFDLPTAQGGCVECHGIRPGAPRGGDVATWRTPIQDVGTDTREWAILLRDAKSGALTGAAIPGFMEPIRQTDLAINILKTAVVGAIVEKTMPADKPMPAPVAADMHGAYRMPSSEGSDTAAAPIVKNGYEARVLQGIWAAAPYLHNGAVPTLADLLKPAAARAKRFAIGPAYDIATVGLAERQPGEAYTLHTTGCAARNSGDSNCGHEYGTSLPEAEKRALLEYLKVL